MITLATAQADVRRESRVDSPEVSITLAAYNASAYLKQAIASILAQPDIRFEIVVVNDGSKDDTLDQALAFTDPRIAVISLARNEGLSVARNTASHYAKAPWLCAFDADDVMLPSTLAPYFAEMRRHPDRVFAYSRLEVMDQSGKPLGQRYQSGHPFDVLLFFQKCIILNPMSMVRRDIFIEAGGYDPQLRNLEDYDLWMRVFEYGDPFSTIGSVSITGAMTKTIL